VAVDHLDAVFEAEFKSLANLRWLPANCFCLIFVMMSQNLGEQ
jgi:hypothetical protein